MAKKIERPSVRAGYDQWSETYDHTPNPLVALDRRHTMQLLRPRTGERILDACAARLFRANRSNIYTATMWRF